MKFNIGIDIGTRGVRMAVEGYGVAFTASAAVAVRKGVDMPIAQAAYEVLYEGRDAHLVLTELMTREKKHELEDSWV